jgi:WD40 repeat protein
VDFSEFSNNILGTGGLAHIRFWKIANTFTGLKLQGETGKFGQIELSDVTGFYIFPDGKVLSGSENGTLLLWEGNLIKVVIAIDEKTPCHNGPINFVKLTKKTATPQIVTAGFDGCIKFWDFEEIDNLLSDDNLRGYLQPNRVFKIMDVPYSNISSIFSKFENLVDCKEVDVEHFGVSKIIDIKFYSDFWMIHDSRGMIFKFNLEKNILLQE